MPKVPANLHIGNTTFRRPWRIPEGLRVLDKFNKNYDFKNNPENYKGYFKFKVLLDNQTHTSWTKFFKYF
jgi:hypothetical protein